MKRWAFLGFLLLWPTLLFAQGSLSLPFSSSFGLTFTPAVQDLSMIYLSNMFGQVDGVLFGTGSQLAGALFGVYNGAILVLGGIVVMYTFLMGTIKTAHEGEMLGQSKEWSSIWTPLRTVGGIALLIPKASGYSFIQIFIMWAIVQGIGVADSMWNVALDYLLKGGIVISQNYAGATKTVGYTPQQVAFGANFGGSPAVMEALFGPPKTTYGSTSINTTPMIHGSAQLLSSLTCVEMLQQQLMNYQTDQKKTGIIPNFYTDIMTAINASSPDSPQTTIPFPDSHYNGTDGACGSVTWSSVASSFAASGVAVPLSNTPLGAAMQGNNDRATAVAASVSTLDSYARQIVQNYLSTSPAALGQLTGPGVWAGPNNSPFIINGSLLGDAAAAYYGTMSSTVRLIAQLAKDPSTIAAWTTGAKIQGWAMAGAFYFNIVTANNQILNVVDKNVPTFAIPANNLSTDTRITNALGGPNSSYVQQLQSLINGQSGQNGSNDTIVASDGPFMVGAMAFGDQLSFGSTNLAPQTAKGGASAGGEVGQFLGPVNYVSSVAGNWLTTLANAQQSNENPVVAIAGFGGSLANASYNALITMAGIGFGITFGLGLMPFDSLGAAGVSITTAVMGFFTPIFVSLLVAGLSMAFYIPMIPFIIFSFGVIGWFIAVVEAMLAAPMVALGIAHPEGSHSILGKAEPAVGLLVNVFLRPTFMIFGLLFGMMISYVGIWLLNQGFGIAFSGATQGITTNGIFEPIACVIIYVLIAMQIVQKSFTLIYTIPDHVLKWIGINVQGLGGEAQAEQAIAQGAHGAFEKMGQHSGQVVDTALKVGEASGKMVKEIVKAIVTRGKGGGAAKAAKGGGGGKGGKGASAGGKAGKNGQHGNHTSGKNAQGTTTPQQHSQPPQQHGGGGGGHGKMGQQLTQIIQTIINNT